jgi:signal transduction histidine kinase
VDVSALVSRVVDEVQSTLGEREIEVRSSSRSLVVHGDEIRLEQVFQNLVQNALKYSRPPAPIVVAVKQHDSSVLVEVRDTGIGIPEAALPQLFERFYRAGNVRGGDIGGMGIGLYVVKEIVELHGGQVTVESIEGQGSTFMVRLPLA